jgi:hypothetical protein
MMNSTLIWFLEDVVKYCTDLVKVWLPDYISRFFVVSNKSVEVALINLVVFLWAQLVRLTFYSCKVGFGLMAREFLYKTGLKRRIDPFSIDYYSLMSNKIAPGDFKMSNRVSSVEAISCFNRFFAEHVMINKFARLEGGISYDIDIAKMYDFNGKFDYEKGLTNASFKTLTYKLVPVWRWGVETDECVYMSCSGTTDLTLYSNSEAGLRQFIAYVTGKYGLPSVSTRSSTRKLQIYDTKRSSSGVKLVAQEETVDSTVTFDDLFYPQKPKLLETLKAFSSGTLYPRKAHKHNLGILLHGEPGCGKTTTIRALANMFGRDIHMVNLSMITTISELETILKQQPYDQKIVVFEEIDLMLGVLNGDNSAEELRDEKLLASTRSVDEEQRRKLLAAAKKMDVDQKEKISLHWFLTYLDGVVQYRNRIIVATTNVDPKNFDRRLLRAGRFDIKLELHPCDAVMFRNIIKNMCEDEDETQIKKIDDFSEWPVHKKWSPSALVTLCALTRCDVDMILQVLTESDPFNFENQYFTL